MQNQDDYCSTSEAGLVCPSFNSYASVSTADTAARVCREFSLLQLLDESPEIEDDDEDADFEFVSFQKSDSEVVFGDSSSRIGPVFPVFNRDLLLDDDDQKSQRDLIITTPPSTEEEAVLSSSSTSSEADEMEGVPEGSYCVWMPKTPTSTPSPTHCKKSKSTGTASSPSKRWRIRDFLRRSNSEGGKALVFLTPSSTNKQLPADDQKVVAASPKEKKSFVGPRPKGPNAVSMAHEVFYAKNKDRDRRQSYLPYRKDLVGFFASVNAMGRTFPTF